MTQFWTIMRRGYVLFFVVLAITCFARPGSVGATLYDLSGSSIFGPSWAFSLRYDDLNNNQRFSFNELVMGTFSGPTIGGNLYSTLVTVPLYNAGSSPFTDGGGAVQLYDAWWWTTATGSKGSQATGNYSYVQSQYTPPVPLPGAVLLLGAGLMRLAAHARRQNG
jgi:hypothetical protein